MDFPHFKYEMNVKIHSIMLVLTRTKLRKQFCHCARSISRRVRSRTWTAIRSLSYSTLSLGITRFWNFSNPLSGCKVTKFEGVKYWPQRGQYLLSNTFGIIAIAQSTQKLLNLTPLALLRGAKGGSNFVTLQPLNGFEKFQNRVIPRVKIDLVRLRMAVQVRDRTRLETERAQ